MSFRIQRVCFLTGPFRVPGAAPLPALSLVAVYCDVVLVVLLLLLLLLLLLSLLLLLLFLLPLLLFSLLLLNVIVSFISVG